MIETTLRVIIGYALASLAAAATLIGQLSVVAGGSTLSFTEFLGAAGMIGIFAWAGLLFAIRAQTLAWTRATTFALGGLLAMLIGIATLLTLSGLQGLTQGYVDWNAATIISLLQNALELLSLGLLPGVVGGLAYWLVAVRTQSVSV